MEGKNAMPQTKNRGFPGLKDAIWATIYIALGALSLRQKDQPS